MLSSKASGDNANAGAMSRSVMEAVVSAFVFAASALVALPAAAQSQPRGFAVERLYQSAPGGGWVVMDSLDMHGDLGGALALSGGYAYRPLRLTAGDRTQALDVVKNEAFYDIGVAVTYRRFRWYLNLTSPVWMRGQSGTVGSYQFTAPAEDLGVIPDLVTDARLGFDVRLLGEANSPFRFGIGAQLIVPNGNRSEYDSDATLRGMLRGLFAGEFGPWTYAAQLGAHIRPLNDSPTPGSPQGSELLFGIAAGPQFAATRDKSVKFVIGPEVFGETAFKSFFGSTTTALEGLLSGRLEGTANKGSQLRIKLGTGRGLHQQFGAPDWRVVFGLEVFDHNAKRAP